MCNIFTFHYSTNLHQRGEQTFAPYSPLLHYTRLTHAHAKRARTRMCVNGFVVSTE